MTIMFFPTLAQLLASWSDYLNADLNAFAHMHDTKASCNDVHVAASVSPWPIHSLRRHMYRVVALHRYTSAVLKSRLFMQSDCSMML